MNLDSGDLLKLAELLKPPEGSEEEIVQKFHDDLPTAGYCTESLPTRKNKAIAEDAKFPKTVEEFEKQEEFQADQCFDSRIEPSYELKYRQAVSAEDVFLQMGPKNSSSASCEDMILSIKLPGEDFINLELDVSKNDITVKGILHKIILPLPSTINPDLSKASWNKDGETLILTLRMEREFDFMNF